MKTKMFVEQMLISRDKDAPLGSWNPPKAQSKPIDDLINEWIDKTGSEVVNVTSPSMFMQWMDAERTQRLVIVSAMVTYIPAVPQLRPIKEDDRAKQLNTTKIGTHTVPPEGWTLR
jgi:hypothetical protein